MMAQFSAGKNPPWARPTEFINVSGAGGLAGPNMAQPQVPTGPLMPHQQGVGGHTPTVYTVAGTAPGMPQPQFAAAQQLAAVAIQQAQQGQMQHGNTVIPQPGIAIPTSLGTNTVPPVSYPNLRPNQQQQQQHHPKQRVFTGTISKLHENFGFVDEDVFFQKSCVKGSMPKVGERVLVEATYNPTMPFKWNAARIQVLPNQPSVNAQGVPGPMGGMKGSLPSGHGGTTGPPPMGMPGIMGPGPMGGMTGGMGGIPGGMGAQGGVPMQQPQIMTQANQPGPGIRGNLPARRGEPIMRYDRDKDRDRERERDRERRDRMRLVRKRSRSPPGRRVSPPTRPRSPLRRRSVRAAPRYVAQIPKLSFDVREANVISIKSRYSNMYIPSDFFNTSFTWIEAFPHARAFQLGQSCHFHVMHKDVQPLSTATSQPEPADADHKYSAKVMLLSSPCLEELYHASCSLADDPTEMRENFQHPTRLLQFLVGLRGKGEPMAIGGAWSPSVDGQNPEEDPRVLINTAIRTTKALTGIDLSGCTKWYRFAEIRYLRAEETHKGRVVPARVETVVVFLPDVWSCTPTQLEWEGLQAAYKKHLRSKLTPDDGTEAASQEEEDSEAMDESEQNDPTHFSELDPRSMKLVDLRRELECRSLSSRGLRSQLIARLTKAMKAEQEQEKEDEGAKAEEAIAAEELKREEAVKVEEVKDPEKLSKEDEEKKRKEEKEKAIQERRYMLPDSPAIIVHPSSTAKGGKFDCTVMSLSLLLDYRQEDNKEHSFEVSLFAELFNEMLMRDLGYCIYKTLVTAPEKKEEEKKDKKKTDGHDKEKDSSAKEAVKEPTNKKQKVEEVDSKKEKDRSKDKKDEKSKGSTKGSKDTDVEESNPDEGDKDEEEEGENEEMEEDGSDEEAERESEETEDKKSEVKAKEKPKDKVVRKRPKRTTIDPQLLLAFVYYDQNHTGYLLDKDVEDILHTIGLQLSRAQVRKLVQKVSVRDSIHYRQLTDKVLDKSNKDSEDLLKISSNGAVMEGNLSFLHTTKRKVSTEDSGSKGSVAKSPAGKQQSGMVSYKGAMLDIQSILQQLEKSEKTRAQMEARCQGATKEIGELKSKYTKSEEKKEKLESEVKKLKTDLEKKAEEMAALDSFSGKVENILTKAKKTLKSLTEEMDVLDPPGPVLVVKKEKN